MAVSGAGAEHASSGGRRFVRTAQHATKPSQEFSMSISTPFAERRAASFAGLPAPAMLAVALLALGAAGASHAAPGEAAADVAATAGATRAGTCATLAGKRFVYMVQGMYGTIYNTLPFAEVGQLAFGPTGATGTTTGVANGPGPVAPHPITTFTCTDLTLPKGFAQITVPDGRTYQVVANNAVNLLKMIRVDANAYAGGEAKLSTDWSTLPAQACTLLSGKTYISTMLGSIVVYTPTSGAYSAFADIWSFATQPGKLSGVWEFGANSPSYHAETGTNMNCVPFDDGAAIVDWVNTGGYYENGYVIYPNADGSAAAVLSTIVGQGAAGWLVKR
jgi:hypothetical protein